MLKENLLREYKRNVEILVKSAKKSGLEDAQIKNLLKESYNNIKSNSKKTLISQNGFKISICLALSLSLFIYVLLYVHTPTSSIVLRNVQGLTYPALKIVRTLSVPIIKLLPSLTDLYDESCLIENPKFYLSDMECWPCENVHSVIDLTGIEDVNAFEKVREGTPFIVKTDQHKISLTDLQELYKNHSVEISFDSRTKIRNSNEKTINELLSLTERNVSSTLHISIRINKMLEARIIRKLFPKPYFFPERTGQAVERFLFVDGHTAGPYTLPNPECSFVFLIQGAGERTVILKPPRECKESCKTVSVLMKPSYVLLYNWWYWRSVSLPGNSDVNLSISYLNSYC